jgi:hypothetical protein
VHGEDLHGVGATLDHARLQSALLLLGCLQVAEEAGQRPTAAVAAEVRGEARGDVEERIEMPARQRLLARPADCHLDVQTDGPLDVGEQVGQRLVESPAQQPKLVPQPRQPAPALR